MSAVGQQARELVNVLLPATRDSPAPTRADLQRVEHDLQELVPLDEFDHQAIREAAETLSYVDERIP